MASPNISELVTVTYRSRTKKLADSVSDNTALLFRLKERGKIKPVSGGTSILQELEYQENATSTTTQGMNSLMYRLAMSSQLPSLTGSKRLLPFLFPDLKVRFKTLVRNE